MDFKFSRFEDQIFFNTVLIENLTDGEAGTGFLFVKPIDEGSVRYLLFSNKHVFWGKNDKDKPNVSKELQISLHIFGRDGKYKPGAIRKLRIKLNRNELGYYEHDEQDIDVACINISEAFNDKNFKYNIRTLDVDKFLDFDYKDLWCGEDIIFIGYPSIFFDRANFLPVMRTGNIASIPSIDFDNKPQILIDAQVFPGSSGSPVFVRHNGSYKFLGIISDAIQRGLDFIEITNTSKTTQNKEVPTKFPIQFIGLGLLYKNNTIKHVLDKI